MGVNRRALERARMKRESLWLVGMWHCYIVIHGEDEVVDEYRNSKIDLLFG